MTLKMTNADISILKQVKEWDVNVYGKCTYFEIANHSEYSESQVQKSLRKLKSKGFVSKSVSGAWHAK